jgi:uncharacterized protein (TIGR03435 family)
MQNVLGIALAAFVLVPGMVVTAAQNQTSKFEVASVKPAARDDLGSEINTRPGGQLIVTNMPLSAMIMYAWEVKRSQVSGITGWIGSQAYDVVAKPDQPRTESEIKSMLKALLADRFGLVIHRETAEQTVYALTVAKPGKTGPGLVEYQQGSCPDFDATKPRAPSEPGKLPTVYCGNFFRGRSWMKGAAVPLANLVDGLSPVVGGTVIDETGLSGKYNISLEWTPAPTASVPPLSDAPNAPPPESTGPTIFTALQEQLGLKLQSRKGLVQLLVIDHAEKPDAN